LKGSPAEEIENQAKKEGMLTMLEDGIYKAALGITTIDEVLRVVAE
jgi:type II secretory ATPase GspE/PulE/Tfp pilus assembly ATPase PilB-like protein